MLVDTKLGVKRVEAKLSYQGCSEPARDSCLRNEVSYRKGSYLPAEHRPTALRCAGRSEVSEIEPTYKGGSETVVAFHIEPKTIAHPLKANTTCVGRCVCVVSCVFEGHLILVAICVCAFVFLCGFMWVN